MSPDKMVYMANQIATFFKSQPGGEQAEKIAGHLRDFWEPRMLGQLRDYVANDGSGIDDNVRKAVELL